MSSSDQKAPDGTITIVAPDAPPKRAPTLYAIIAFKLLKGSLFFTLAISLYRLSDNDLPKEFQHLMDILKVPPGNKFWTRLAEKVGDLTELKMLWAAVGTLIYSLFSLVEGVGLIFRVSWAGWLAIAESMFFVSLEVLDLVESFSWYIFVVMIINVFIVFYLFKNRHRLFRHHHHETTS